MGSAPTARARLNPRLRIITPKSSFGKQRPGNKDQKKACPAAILLSWRGCAGCAGKAGRSFAAHDFGYIRVSPLRLHRMFHAPREAPTPGFYPGWGLSLL